MLTGVPFEEANEVLEINRVKSGIFTTIEQRASMVESTIKSFVSEVPKNSSLKTISSISNSLIGSSVVVFAIQFKNAGIISSLIVLIILGLVCRKTCSIQIRHFREDESDLPEIIHRILGNRWRILFIVSSSFLLFLVGIIQFTLSMNMFYPFLQFIFSNSLPSQSTLSFGTFSYQYLGLISAILFYLMFNFLEIQILIKIAAIGIISVTFFIIYIIYKAALNFGNVADIPLFVTDPKAYILLLGMYSLSFLIHNGILTIMKHNQNFENNQRDLSLGYLLAFAIYSFIGIFGSIALSNVNTDGKNTFFDCFDETYVQAILRLLLGFQLSSVMPIAWYISKSHFFNLIYETELPPLRIVQIANILFCIICYVIQSFNIDPSLLISVTGSIGGFISMYVIPIRIHLKCLEHHRSSDELSCEIIGVNRCASIHKSLLSRTSIKARKFIYFGILLIGILMMVAQFFKIFGN